MTTKHDEPLGKYAWPGNGAQPKGINELLNYGHGYSTYSPPRSQHFPMIYVFLSPYSMFLPMQRSPGLRFGCRIPTRLARTTSLSERRNFNRSQQLTPISDSAFCALKTCPIRSTPAHFAFVWHLFLFFNNTPSSKRFSQLLSKSVSRQARRNKK